jgi:hypothetical protein
MKIDKDFVVKNHFWLLLGSAVLLTLVGWVLLLVTVPGKVKRDRDSVEKKWDSLKKQKDFVAAEAVEAARQEAQNRNQERSTIHKSLHLAQSKDAGLSTWPKSLTSAYFDLNNGKYALEVVIHPPKTDLKSLPPDDDTHCHGTLNGDTDQDWFKIKTRDGKTIQFFRLSDPGKTPAMKISELGKAENLPFGDLSKNEGRQVAVTYVTGRFFGDDLTDNEVRAYCNGYKEQLAGALAELGPVNVLDQPVVLLRYARDDAAKGQYRPEVRVGVPPPKDNLKGEPTDEDELANDTWIFKKDKLPPADNRFFSYVPAWGVNTNSEEVWAAQENLWVQRELFRQIKAANDALAHCTPLNPDKDGKATKFRNYYWEIELQVSPEGVRAKLTNRRPKRQVIDNLHFLVRFSKDKAEPVMFPPKGVAFEGVPVAPGETFTTKAAIEMPANTGLQGVYSVEQVLTVDTAAVKRLDVLAIGAATNGDMAVSHRQSFRTLLPYKKKPKVDDSKDNKPEDGSKEGRPKDGVPGPGPGSPDLTSSKLSKNGLVLERYLEVTPELRRLPVNLVLIVDPDQVARVEAALVNSPLRFLTTQVMLQRAQVALGTEPPKKEGGTFGSGFKGPGESSIAPPGTGDSAGMESEENIELVIYGVLTLYERPGRPAPPTEQK